MTNDVDELEPDVPLDRNDETLVDERVDTLRGAGACCGLRGPTRGDMFDLGALQHY